MVTLDNMINELVDVNLESVEPVVTPIKVKSEFSLTEKAANFVLNSRYSIRKILDRDDDRLIVVTGPCSIHNYDAAIEFGKEIKYLSDEVGDKILLIMRTYFEKPRTVGGWEGLIHDPDINGSCDIDKGYRTARRLLLELAEMEVPTAIEIVEITSTPNYIDDLISWACIGARTSESQLHRKIGSGLSMPTGVKNSTSGDIQVAVDAVKRLAEKSVQVGDDANSVTAKITTKGNKYSHIVLRGGNSQTNYHQEGVREAVRLLENSGLKLNIMIDCSHGNSGKDYKRQHEVWDNVIYQRIKGNRNIIGVMLESNHMEGKQKFEYLKDNSSNLSPYVSITDSCISKEENRRLIRDAFRKL